MIKNASCFFMPRPERSGQMNIRAQLKQPGRVREITGHELIAKERFVEDTRHVIVFDVLTRDCPIGNKGERLESFYQMLAASKL